MNNLAVIGIDALFDEQGNIDRVERAFYLGKSQGQSLGKDLGKSSAENLNLEPNLKADNNLSFQDADSLLKASVARLAQANNIAPTSIDVILITETENLADALINISKQLADGSNPIALIGINTFSTSSSSIVKGTNKNHTENHAEIKATIAFDEQFDAYCDVEGIASLLIASDEFVKQNSSYVYANIKGFAVKNSTHSSVAQVITQSMKIAGIGFKKIKLLEVSALAEPSLATNEITGLLEAYSANKHTLQTAISSARSVTGEGHGFSQVAGLLKTVISLQQQYIPGLADWTSPTTSTLEQWQASAFYFPTEARPCYPNADKSLHCAAYSCMTENSYCHLVLEEGQLADSMVAADNAVDNAATNTKHEVRQNGFLACSNLSLVLISFNDQKQLLEQLETLDKNCQQLIDSTLASQIVRTLAMQCYEKFRTAQASTKYRICLIAENTDELFKEINLAKLGVIKILDEINPQKTEWKTPKGSYFSAAPVSINYDVQDPSADSKSNVAFFYPGIGATYVGLGRDLFHLFPEIYQPVAALADDIGETLKDTLLNPRSITALDFKQLKQLDSNLRNSLANIAECGVAFACVFTKIFEEVFDIYADFSAGYSMGEVSMYAALGCWQQPGLMSARLANSETFNNKLSGELSTLRNLWNLESSANSHDEKIWETYSIRATLDEVNEAAKGEDRVYCTIVNTPDNLLIGGYPEACERVIKKLGVRSMAMDMPNAIHSKPAHENYPAMAELFTMEVTQRIETKMFSSSCYLPIPHRTKAIANSIAKCLCDQVDFPRLVNSLHDRGARVFVEMGPGRSLCSWADKILKHEQPKPHASVPVNAKGTSDELTYIRALAKLISHGVNANIDKLFNGSIVVQVHKNQNQE